MAVYCAVANDENIFTEYFNYVLESLNLHPPANWREALALFQHLMQIAE